MSDRGPEMRGDKTFPSERVPLVCLEEGPSGRGGSDAVHLPALNALALTSGRQPSSRRAGGPGRQNHGGRDSSFLEITKLVRTWGGWGNYQEQA